jgi:cation:H+ antiporter
MAFYGYGMRLITVTRRQSMPSPAAAIEPPEKLPSLKTAGIGFSAGVVILWVTAPWFVHSAVGVAEITGLSTGFVGTALVAVVTPLPEVTTTLAAARLGAYDLAIGNLFGSNLFNMFALGFADLFFLQGRLLGVIDPAITLAGLIALILTSIGLIGNLAREERRFGFMELDALLILIGYSVGIWLLYSRGIG